MMYIVYIFLLAIFCFLSYELNRKNIRIWIGSYFKQIIKGRPKLKRGEAIHIMFCVVDHFEPISEGSTKEEERERMKAWIECYPEMAHKHSDSNGRPPQHTWFYPGEAYNSEYLDGLTGLCKKGYGEIELHHHHHHETSDNLRRLIKSAISKFSKHGALLANIDTKQFTYGFIHGNLALDNSRFDDKWCGVNDELTILKETGCYADFSSPTAPCVSQTKKINSIYYAKDDPGKPKSHNIGINVEVGKKPSGDLMIIQGPLSLNWSNRKYGVLPKIDNAEIDKREPGTPERIERWVKQHIHVEGKPEWIFIKVSCHGAENENFDELLGKLAGKMYSYLEEKYCNQNNYQLHYVTARELYNIVKAAEAGEDGDPYQYRNYLIPEYHYRPAE